MRIDHPKLRSLVARYLRTPESEPVYDEFEVPPALSAALTFVALVAGSVLVPTLIGTRFGLKLIGFAIRGEAFDSRGKHLRAEPDRLRPLIAHGIIIGPSGHGLVLGSFDTRVEANTEFLAERAALLAHLYAEGSDAPDDQAALALMRDDNYRRNRRRPVPEPQAQGRSLTLFDIKIDPEQIGVGPGGGILVACVATGPDDADPLIVQIPWSVVADAVTD